MVQPDEFAEAIALARGGEPGGEDTAVGRMLFSLDGQPLGILREGRVRGQRALVFQDPQNEFAFPQAFRGGGEFLTSTGQIIEINSRGIILGSRTLSQSEREGLGLSPGTEAGDGGADQFALQASSQAFQRSEREASQEFSERINRLNALDDLTGQLANLQVQARTTAIESIGRDPFRGAIRAQAGIPVGRSPFRRLQEELRGFGAAGLPGVAPGATTGEIQAGIDEATGLIRNVSRRPIGLQGGGIIDMERDGDGTFSVRDRRTGRTGDSILVGETEAELVQPLEDGSIRVVPLSQAEGGGFRLAGRAQGGGVFERDLIGEPFERRRQAFAPDPRSESLIRAQTLAPVFSALGFDEVPLISRGPAAFGGVQGRPLLGSGVGLPTQAPSPSGVFGRLGTRPRLIFEPNEGVFLAVSPTGVVEELGTPQEAVSRFQIDPSDAVTATREQLTQMGFRTGGQREESLLFQGGGRFAELGPIVAPLNEDQSVGILLPDPRLLAPIWNDLDPATQDAVISAYGTAEIGEQELLSRLNFFSPRGTATGVSARLG